KVWPNKYGTEGDGYVTYPRNYKPGTKLPVMVVTHGSDAGNRFAYDGFQWEYPVQVFAEHGYLVLSVNEPAITPRNRAAMDAWAKLSSNVAADQMQFAAAYEAVATMEAALQWAIDEGLADPSKAGIAGYSRGSHVVKFVLSQSRLFKAGSGGDAAWFSASSYWDGISRNLYLSIFGGSPFDPKSLDNYRKLSPSFRTHDFSGPLLQEFTVRSAYSGVELDTLLREAGIPTELVFYLDETHIPWHPKRRASSMRLNFDWFNFWLLGSEDAAPEKAAQYARWRAMREKWNATGDREAPRDHRGG
ncbi:MAG TPA: prolyl oligopeptidase family serine peptidase, partial [Usitatibacter sp.]|nr:prolyl oligopeptidase family serine peptidase [Usitatibacter sp.]